MKKALCLITFLLVITSVSSQKLVQSANFINHASDYRSVILASIKLEPDGVKLALTNWYKKEKCEADLFDLLRNINLNTLTYGVHYKHFEANIIRNFKKSKLAKQAGELDLYIIQQNPEFIELLTSQIINSEYPFSLSLSKFFNEIEFLNLDKNDVYGEMDMNLGMKAYLLAMYDQSLKMQIYTPNDLTVKYTKDKFQTNQSKVNLDNIQIMKFPDVDSLYEKHHLDCLVIRNIFQHVLSKVDYIKYLKPFLKPNGKLIIESYFTENKSKCYSALEITETIELFSQNGFNLQDQLIQENSVLLKFTSSEIDSRKNH